MFRIHASLPLIAEQGFAALEEFPQRLTDDPRTIARVSSPGPTRSAARLVRRPREAVDPGEGGFVY